MSLSVRSYRKEMKWHPTPPPPPSPVMIHLPRRHRQRNGEKKKNKNKERDEKCKFDMENEKENDANMETTLRSALRFLGKKKVCEEHEGNSELNEEMGELEEKLEGLLRKKVTSRDFETTKSNDFYKKAFILQRRLEKLGRESKEKRPTEIRDMAQLNLPLESRHRVEDTSLVSAPDNCNKFFDVESLRKKMEGISKGVYKRMKDEYGAMLVSNTHTPSTSASTSKRFEFPDDPSSLSTRPPHQGLKCSGHCKIIVRKIMEQVREESKQWSEMQEMLGQVREEMDQIKDSRDCWQRRALDSEHQNHSLHSTAQEWKMKAVTIRSKAKALKREVYALTAVLNNFGESRNAEKKKVEDCPGIISLGAHIAKEKRELVYRLKEKENHRSTSREIKQERLNNKRKSHILDHDVAGSKRFPFQNIGNLASPKAKQNGKESFPT